MERRPRILIVEESRYHALLITREITKALPEAVLSVYHYGRAALDELRRSNYDIAVVDNDLTGLQHLEFLAIVGQEGIDVPVILLSTVMSEDARVQAIKAGASQYVVRDDAYYLIVPRMIEEVLHNHQLVKLSRQLEQRLNSRESTEIISIVTGTLAHEINNPLMTILGISELLLNDVDQMDPAIASKIQKIQDSALRIQAALATLATTDSPDIRHTPSGGLISSVPVRSNPVNRI
ncbi:MAG TPA: response regulator [Candidatus Acidoferrum sp.]|nr:response regulator [Candidatus Acidoferrum sp.]